ncbi:MAG: peptidoglycan-binding protein [Devosiaceae bacterium]|nr:peptidoglycan-binding protein [Devosiaceae bacterium]
MAQARRFNHWQEISDPWQKSQPGQDVDNWNELRGELEDLLDQVHMQSHDAQIRATSAIEPARSANFTSTYQQPFNPSAPAALDRHSHALASVQRAVDRFSEPEEAMIMPARSQHQLQNAIRQIRSSQRGRQQRPKIGSRTNTGGAPFQSPQSQQHHGYGGNPPHTSARAEVQFDEIGNALESISARMESFEQAIGDRQNSDTAVADMAMQVEQLSGVVEHLANNIGERGQIKRLENQIAKMADAIPNGADLDFASLDKRLDVLSGAFEKLRDLQAQQLELSINSSGDDSQMEAIDQGVRNINERLDNLGINALDLKPIEDCVRSVYDRIDTLEQSVATPSPALERLSEEMAHFTQAMRDEKGGDLSANLVAQVEGLVERIEQIETEGTPVAELKIDMEELQSSVIAAMEPRFLALEDKIGSLSGKLGGKAAFAGEVQHNSINTEALEEHIRELADKLDKTSSDLNGLQTIFDQRDDKANVPDLDSIANIVAQRTSEAMAKLQSKPGESVGQKALDRLEGRLSDLFAERTQQQDPQEFSQVRSTINQVNQRLERLEATLSEQAKHASHQTSTQHQPISHTPKSPPGRRRAAPKRLRHPGLAHEKTSLEAKEENWEPSAHLLPELRDNMPRPPAQDGPLKAPVFEDEKMRTGIPVPDPLRVEPDDLEVRESELYEIDANHLSTPFGEETGNDGRIKLPKFTDENVVPPPAPASSFSSKNQPDKNAGTKHQPISGRGQSEASSAAGTGDKANFGRTQKPYAPPQANPEAGKVSRSTFIEAARRAAQSKNIDLETGESQSLIARAMARFQIKKSDDEQKDSQVNSDNAALSKNIGTPDESSFGVGQKPASPDDLELDDLTTVQESFITRHRQPILLAAAVVAVGFLTLNLINQRFSSADPQPATTVSEMETAITPQERGDGANTSPITTPEQSGSQNTAKGSAGSVEDNTVPEDVTGSIDRFSGVPGSPVRVIEPSTVMEMPARLNQDARIDRASLSMNVPSSSPIDLEMPPEAIGPLLLRQTAANGDPRAQFEVGAIFVEGRAVTQDLSAAAKWYERAAAQGFAPAGYRLANMLENGIGVEKDLSSARLWYQLAADAGNRMSMHNLASLLASGQLGEQQFESAAHWFEQAGSLGLTDSQFNLGMLYARGLGVPQSLENSFKWFSLAAAAGDADAAKARDDIARSLDASVVARLNNDILTWQPATMNIRANFAPIGSWSDNFDPGPEIEAREVILKVQAALNGIGFDTGTPDGLIGPKTIEAITGFETQAGMTPSGKVNPRLLAVLGSQPV